MSEKKYEIKWSKKSKIVSIRTVEGEVILTTNQRLKVECQCINYKMCKTIVERTTSDYSMERKEWEESNPIFKKHKICYNIWMCHHTTNVLWRF